MSKERPYEDRWNEDTQSLMLGNFMSKFSWLQSEWYWDAEAIISWLGIPKKIRFTYSFN